jgi:hypothetical protein
MHNNLCLLPKINFFRFPDIWGDVSTNASKCECSFCLNWTILTRVRSVIDQMIVNGHSLMIPSSRHLNKNPNDRVLG